MEVHLTSTDLRRWKRGETSPDEVVSIARHLHSCAECRALSEQEWSLRDVALELEAIDEHPSADELFAYGEGTLADPRRASVASHVLACERCREDVGDAKEIIGTRRSRWSRRTIALAVAAALIVLIVTALLLRPRSTEMPPVVTTTTPPTMTVTTATTTTYAPPDALAGLDPSLRRFAAALLDGEFPSAAILAAVRSPAERERSPRTGDDEFSVVRPVGEVVEETRPLFQWRGESGRFTVEIFDERMQLLVESPPLSAHEWRPRDPLPHSRVLVWEVRLATDGESRIAPRPPDPPARFRIADPEAIDAARTTRSALEAALIYAREGMIDEARSKMREAATRNESEDIRRMVETLDAADQRSRPKTMNGAQ